MTRLSIKKIVNEKIIDTDATVKGWIRSVRNSKKFSFIVLNDGSSQDNLQIIVDEVLPNYAEVAALLSGSAVSITGRLVQGGGKIPQIEMQAKEIEIIGKTDDSYPLQKKATSLKQKKII